MLKHCLKGVLCHEMWVSAHEQLSSQSFSEYIFLREIFIFLFSLVFQTTLVLEEGKANRSFKERNLFVAHVL